MPSRRSLFAREQRTDLAAEIRLRLDGLGASPKGRRNLRWRYVEPAEIVEHLVVSSRAGTRRHRLGAVDPETP